jgi:hypothetical protein
MALLPCPECKKDVSDKAPTCPHCGYPLMARGSGRGRMTLVVAVVLVAAALVGAGVAMAHRGGDYSRVEQLRAEQDADGTHDEHVRQRFFRLYEANPGNAMYIYLWSRCVDDAAKQLELAQQGMKADPSFSWNYNMASRALARLNRLPEAYDQAVKGAALDPGNLELANKLTTQKLIIDHKLAEKPRPVDGVAAKYEGLFRSPVRSPDGADLQAIEKTRLPDSKDVSEGIRGFVVCANPYADSCIRAYVPRDDRYKMAWPHPSTDVGALREHQLLTVTGTMVTNAKGEPILLADVVTVEPR